MINKDKAKDIRDEVKAALQSICEKHGVKFAGINVTYTETDVKLVCKVEDTTEIAGVEWSPEEAAFLRKAHEFGLKPTDLGSEVEIQGNTWILSGLKPQNTKYPVLARRSWDGKLFKFAARDVVAGLRAARS
jgi:hypothetical protein